LNDDNRSRIYNVAVGLLCLAAFIFLFWGLLHYFNTVPQDETTIKLPLLVIIGVMALFATLALVAVTFSVAGLSDKSQALGLPEGSVRAAIALSLIVIFAILAIYLYDSINSIKTSDYGDGQKAATDFAKQAFTVVGTLMTSVASFYFASRASTPTASPKPSSPALVSITPAQVSKATATGPVGIKISGTNLQLAQTVRFESVGANAILASSVTSSDQSVSCEITIDPSLAPGKYDVIVTNTDGTTAKLPSAFEILA
jgi:TRAP-type C4-dicarboxylate transport system permease small subunit